MVGPEIVTIHYGNAQIAPTTQAKYPTDAEAIRNDENGKPYVRGSAYLVRTRIESAITAASPARRTKSSATSSATTAR